VPVSLRRVGGPHIEARGLLRESVDALRPRMKVELLYAQRMYIRSRKVIVMLC
jgi:hypothetical protein